MRDKKFKEKIEVISELSEDLSIAEEVKELTIESENVHKKNFYFIVRSSFGSYRKGDKIEDDESIDSIVESGFSCRVIKVFNK